MSDNDERQATVPEGVLEPELRICDPHQHLWEYPGNVYLGRELLEDIGGHNVVATVAVEAWPRNVRDHGGLVEPWQETARAVAESRHNSGRTVIAAGIVGYADLMQGRAVESVIEAHIQAGEGRLRGVRAAADSPLADESFLEGCSVAARYGLSIDLVARDEELRALVGLADRFPDTPVIINHLGLRPVWPPSPAGTNTAHDFAAWASVIAEIARCPNLYMKLGGLGMDLISAGWTRTHAPASAPLDSTELAEIMRPWYFHCIEQFGADRCMLESNFPVDRRSFSYNVHWNAAKRLTAGLSPAERESLFYDTAANAYRL